MTKLSIIEIDIDKNNINQSIRREVDTIIETKLNELRHLAIKGNPVDLMNYNIAYLSKDRERLKLTAEFNKIAEQIMNFELVETY